MVFSWWFSSSHLSLFSDFISLLFLLSPILWQQTRPLWSKTATNTDCRAGPLACPFARALRCVPLRSLVRSLAHFAHSAHYHARGTVNDWMAILSVFFSIFDHSASVFFQNGGPEGSLEDLVAEDLVRRRQLLGTGSQIYVLRHGPNSRRI